MKDKYAIYVRKEDGHNIFIVADRELCEVAGLPMEACMVCLPGNEFYAHLVCYCLNKSANDIFKNILNDVLHQLVKSLEIQAKEEKFVEGKTQEWSGLNFEEILENLKKGK